MVHNHLKVPFGANFNDLIYYLHPKMSINDLIYQSLLLLISSLLPLLSHNRVWPKCINYYSSVLRKTFGGADETRYLRNGKLLNHNPSSSHNIKGEKEEEQECITFVKMNTTAAVKRRGGGGDRGLR